MSALLSRVDQAVSVTDITRSAKKYFDKLTTGNQDRYVIMKNNAPAAVMLAISEYEQMVEELDDLRVEMMALERMSKVTEDTELVSLDEMRERFK
ncbi:MAG: type II toxin-antitoxin system Phd/YefM family antitoxin [Gammaproteobacteria bacterium]|nr:type II toxin-antitoxin system Phd/YefM family antitoxin [Gammaproteobacteria bacterium]